MKNKWSGIVALGGLLLSLGIFAPGCMVRMHTRGAVVVDEQPPEPQYEAQPQARRGYVWVRGHWEWRNSRWKWKRGNWKRARGNQAWVAGHWERRDNRWHWIDGRWGAGSARGDVKVRDHSRPPPTSGVRTRDHSTPPAATGPTAAPPADRCANNPPRRGKVWQCGRWEWRNGSWKWKPGDYVNERAGWRWQPGHWERQGNVFVWVDGRWMQ